MKYNAKGNLVAKIAVFNDTNSTNYVLTKMGVTISILNGKIIADNTFGFNSYLVNPNSVGIVTVTFDKGSTKRTANLLSGDWWFSIWTN